MTTNFIKLMMAAYFGSTITYTIATWPKLHVMEDNIKFRIERLEKAIKEKTIKDLVYDYKGEPNIQTIESQNYACYKINDTEYLCSKIEKK